MPALDQCRLAFNRTGDIAFAWLMRNRADEDDDHDDETRDGGRSGLSTSLCALDTFDYSLIGTTDARKYIQHMSISNDDAHIAIVENETECSDLFAMDVNSVRMYAIGSVREEDEASIGGVGVDLVALACAVRVTPRAMKITR